MKDIDLLVLRNALRIFLFLGLVFIIAGCATGGKDTRPSQESLEDAVKRYWDLRVMGDKFRSFEYERVSLKKEQGIKDAYMRGFSRGVSIKDFKIKEIGEEGSGNEGYTPVKIVLKHSPHNLPFKARDFYEIEIMDYWQKIDGRWYHIIVDLAGDH